MDYINLSVDRVEFSDYTAYERCSCRYAQMGLHPLNILVNKTLWCVPLQLLLC